MDLMKQVKEMTLTMAKHTADLAAREDTFQAAQLTFQAAQTAAAGLAAAGAHGVTHGVQQQIVTAPTFCTGRTTDSKSESPSTFLQNIRASKNKYGWSDEVAVTQATSAFREDALMWWMNMLPMKNPAKKALLKTDFEAFALAFSTQFHVIDTAAGSHSADMVPQKKSEPMTMYINRMSTLFTLATEEVNEGSLPEGIPKNFPTEEWDFAPPRTKRALAKWVSLQLPAWLTKHTSKIIIPMLKGGLRDDRFKSTVHTHSRSTFEQFHDAILLKENELETKTFDSSNSSFKKKNGRGVSAISEQESQDPEESDYSQVQVSAVGKSGPNTRGRGRGRGGRGSNTTRSADYYSKKCNFCEKVGHLENDCFSKKKSLKTVNNVNTTGEMSQSFDQAPLNYQGAR